MNDGACILSLLSGIDMSHGMILAKLPGEARIRNHLITILHRRDPLFLLTRRHEILSKESNISFISMLVFRCSSEQHER